MTPSLLARHAHLIVTGTVSDPTPTELFLARVILDMAQGTSSGYLRAKPESPVELTLKGREAIL